MVGDVTKVWETDSGCIGEGILCAGGEPLNQRSVENVVFDLDIKVFPG